MVICCPACMVSMRSSIMPSSSIRRLSITASACNGCVASDWNDCGLASSPVADLYASDSILVMTNW